MQNFFVKLKRRALTLSIENWFTTELELTS